MPAVYRTAPAREACDALLDTGDGRLSALFDRLAVRRVSADDAVGGVGRSLFDVDTPADHNQAARVIADRALSESNWEVAPTR